MKSIYQTEIQKELNKHGWQDDPRHIEAYMRLGHGTLNHLSPELFEEEVIICHYCIQKSGIEGAEELAQTYNL